METARDLLIRLGMTDWNATQVIPMLWMAPAQTDAATPGQVVLVRHLQSHLRQMGATTVPLDGVLGAPTVIELRKITGRDWPAMHWYEIVRAVLDAQDAGTRLHPGVAAGRVRRPVPVGDLGALPTMPGGPLGWLAAAAAIYYVTTRR